MGNVLIFLGLGLLIFIFFPVVNEEVKYTLRQVTHETPNLDPPSKDFSIVIPKIAAVAPIIPNVDATNKQIYLPALKKGVAQAKGTALPSEVGNMYLFAHSTDAFWNVATYNAVFYLIGKLEKGDEIDIYYMGKLVKYKVYDKKVVNADSSQYFGTILPGKKTLTLQTCYPPGTTLKRLVVLAKEVSP